jgi:hypothetical protein
MSAARKTNTIRMSIEDYEREIDAMSIKSENKINNGTIDLRKEPDYDQYRIVFYYADNKEELIKFNEMCNNLSKSGWDPLYPPMPMSYGSSGNIKMYQQWIFRVKKEEKKIEEKPLKAEVIGTVLMKKPWEDDDDY